MSRARGEQNGPTVAPARWRRSNPWMTSIVDLSTSTDRAHPGGIIGLAPGRSGTCVKNWIALQTGEFWAAVKVVAIDPSAPYAAGIRSALPGARIVLAHFHLVLLPNTMLTDVRQRAAHDQPGRGVSQFTIGDLARLLSGHDGPAGLHSYASRSTRRTKDNHPPAQWRQKSRESDPPTRPSCPGRQGRHVPPEVGPFKAPRHP